MTTITLTSADALLAAKAALANCLPDRITPVLCGAQFAIVDGRLVISATDRYTVSRHRVAAQVVNEDGRLAPAGKLRDELAVIVPREALAWLSKNAAAFRNSTFGGKVTFDFHPEAPGASTKLQPTAGHVTITVAPIVGDREALAATFMLIAGKFPPIDRLFEDAKPATQVATLALNVQHLTKLKAFVPRDIAPHFEFTESRNGVPGPIKITIPGLNLDALLQPTRIG